MASTTPQTGSTRRRPISRPTTPLRPSSRSSLRESGKASAGGGSYAPLEAFEPSFAELSDSMADLELNFMNLQVLNDSLSRFSENFASFLYGLNMNAFTTDFPEAPISDSFRRAREQEDQLGRPLPYLASFHSQYVGRSTGSRGDYEIMDGETTFLTTDTSFIDNPPTSSKATSKVSIPAPASKIGGAGRGGPAGRGGAVRGGLRGTRGSGLARAAKGRSVK
ncbi:dash complex subunit [Drepanopeziza brunnea f. sp. 'multigermtubi' MB_m1]|uniref:DASH complex subunit DAM1 n=1 Tax=Marssonina brunnea f. sp. multigermtubi (strain MB_m1) TaxID=1072389 RepID=K1X003_MARBU|nr:dash complex subunit [Drepanopeziza brunnea f. sp. 'multigermtubi' MB_m1]EKD14198.1 dash complex subunit [Drepanopeziza brunnea f. sp. 'multigermtubi' MB_m1]